MTDHFDAVATFVDNEPVGAPDLAAALDDPSAREYFIDLLVLRGLIGDAQVAGGFHRSTGSRWPGFDHGQPATGSARRGLWLTAAAALVTVGLAGFLAGRTITGPLAPVDAHLTSGAAEPGTTTSAPAPTHVIRMEKGVDWNERSGGN